jgi:hypothetical protein
VEGERDRIDRVHHHSLPRGPRLTQLRVPVSRPFLRRSHAPDGNLTWLHLPLSPDMARTCCPQYTIRLEAEAFQKPGKRQRRTLSRFNRLILTGSQDFGAGT